MWEFLNKDISTPITDPIKKVFKRLFAAVGKRWLVLLLALLFIWFFIRPAYVRRLCINREMDYAAGKGLSAKTVNSRFRRCLVEHGMKPESVFVQTE